MYLTKPQKLAGIGKTSEALNLLPQPGTSSDPRADIVRSRIELARGNKLEALSVVEQTKTRFPNYMPAHLFEAIASYDLSDIPAALNAIDRVLKLQPHNDLALSYRALFNLASGRQDEAISPWKRSGFSDNLDFRIRLIEFLETSWLQSGEYFSSRKLNETNIPRKISNRKAIACFYKHDFAGVIAHSAPPPDLNVESAHLAAFAYEMLNDYDTAQQYIDGFIEQKDQWPDALIAMQARLLVRRGHMAEAAHQIARITTIGPEDFGSNYYLGVICLSYEMQTEARSYFRRALTAYLPDTLDFQWWKIERLLLSETP